MLSWTAPVLASFTDPVPMSGSDQCQTPSALSADEHTVCALFHEMIGDFIALDAEAVLEHFWAEGFSAALSTDLIVEYESWAQMYADLLSGADQVEHVEFPDVVVRTIAEDVILLLNTYDETLVMQSGDRLELQGYGAQVWVRRQGEWRIVHVAGQ